MTIPADDTNRNLAHANPDDHYTPHIGLVGDTYTVLLSAKDTAGNYCLIDMHIPPGGGPRPHRHDFEGTFHRPRRRNRSHVPSREDDRQGRRNQSYPRQCPAPVPKWHQPATTPSVHLRPPGQEDFFAQVGVSVATRTTRHQNPLQRIRPNSGLAQALAPKYKTEFLPLV